MNSSSSQLYSVRNLMAAAIRHGRCSLDNWYGMHYTLTCIVSLSVKLQWTVSCHIGLRSVTINCSCSLIVSHLSSTRRARTPTIESLVNDKHGFLPWAKSWTSHLFSLRNWCTRWRTISHLITFLSSTSTTVQFCAHRNRITAWKTHFDATCINNSIYANWFLRVHSSVPFEIFTVLPQNPTAFLFFFLVAILTDNCMYFSALGKLLFRQPSYKRIWKTCWNY